MRSAIALDRIGDAVRFDIYGTRCRIGNTMVLGIHRHISSSRLEEKINDKKQVMKLV